MSSQSPVTGLPADAVTNTAGVLAVSRPEGASRWRRLVTPAMLLLTCAVLLLYISRLELDSIEQRSLTADFIAQRAWEHLKLTGFSTAVVIGLAIPLGALLTRPFARRITAPTLAFVNVAQALPPIGIIVLIAIIWGVGFDKAVIALILYSLLPVLRNTMVALGQVNPSVVDAARGMGMSKWAVLRRIELPLAVPVILAGVRVALVINVGTATLATFTNGGGLGELINNGLRLGRQSVLVVGSVLTTVLALAIDWLTGVAEDILKPRGV